MILLTRIILLLLGVSLTHNLVNGQLHFLQQEVSQLLDDFETARTAGQPSQVTIPLPDGTTVLYQFKHTTLPTLEAYDPQTSPMFLFDGTSLEGPGLLKGEVIQLHGGFSEESGLGITFDSNLRGSIYLDQVWPEDEGYIQGQVQYKVYDRQYALRVVTEQESNNRRLLHPHEVLTNSYDHKESPQSMKSSHLRGLNDETCPDPKYSEEGELNFFNSGTTCNAEYNRESCNYSHGSCCGPYNQECSRSANPLCGCVDPRYENMQIRKYRVLLSSTKFISHTLGNETAAFNRLVEQVHRINLVLVKELGVVFQIIKESFQAMGVVLGYSDDPDAEPVTGNNTVPYRDDLFRDIWQVNMTDFINNTLDLPLESVDVNINVWAASVPGAKDYDMHIFNHALVCDTSSLMISNNGTTAVYKDVKHILPVSYNVLNGGRTFFRNFLLASGFSLGIGVPTSGCITSNYDVADLEFTNYYALRRNRPSEKGVGFSAMAMPHGFCEEEQPNPLRTTIFNPRAMESIHRNKVNPFQGGRCGTTLDTVPKQQVDPSLSYDQSVTSPQCNVPVETPFRLFAVNAPLDIESTTYAWELVDLGETWDQRWYERDDQGPLLFPLREPKIFPDRVFPRMASVVQGELYVNPSEQLSTSPHTSNFTLVSRKRMMSSSLSKVQSTNALSERVPVHFEGDALAVEALTTDGIELSVTWSGGTPDTSTIRIRASVYSSDTSALEEGFYISAGEVDISQLTTKLELSSKTGLCGNGENDRLRILVESAKRTDGSYLDGCTYFALSPNSIQIPKCTSNSEDSEMIRPVIVGKDDSATLNSSWVVDMGDTNTLTFEMFDVEEGVDFVKVYDGKDNQAPLIRSLTGHFVPFPVRASGKELFVEYIRDGENETRGFRAKGMTAQEDTGPSGDNLTTTILLSVFGVAAVSALVWYATHSSILSPTSTQIAQPEGSALPVEEVVPKAL